MTDSLGLRPFLRESLMIEGILREPTSEEMAATEDFVLAEAITIQRLSDLASIYQPDAVLRDRHGLNVCVGNHIAPPGGYSIGPALLAVLDSAESPHSDPWIVHVEYETLHPFTDGNGRSGRALWAWQMVRRHGRLPGISFLHWAYYQALSHAPERFAGAMKQTPPPPSL